LIAIDNPDDDEMIDWATNFQKEGDNRVYTINSYQQVKAHHEVNREVTQDVTEIPYEKRDNEVGRMVTEAYIRRWRLVKQHLRGNARYWWLPAA
jgi:hypothetical protein